MGALRRLTPLVLLFAAAAHADEIVLLEDGGRTIRVIDTSDGSTREPQTIKGISMFSRLHAIDTRPANGRLYAIGSNGLYTVEPASGWATAVAARVLRYRSFLDGAGLDFDPVADVARVTFGAIRFGAGRRTAKMLRIDADTGETLDPEEDWTRLAYADGDPAESSGLVHFTVAHGKVDGERSPSSTLYGIDLSRSSLFQVRLPGAMPLPGDGDVHTVAGVTSIFGPLSPNDGCLDIAPDGTAFLCTGHGGGLYRLDLGTGATSIVRFMPPAGVLDIAVLTSGHGESIRFLDVTRAAARFDFIRRNRHSFELRGTLPPRTEGWSGAIVRVSIENVRQERGALLREFVLDARGRSRTPTSSFVVRTGARTGPATFVLKFAGHDLDALGIEASSASQSVLASVDFLVDGRPLRTVLGLDFVARGRRGTATLAR